MTILRPTPPPPVTTTISPPSIPSTPPVSEMDYLINKYFKPKENEDWISTKTVVVIIHPSKTGSTVSNMLRKDTQIEFGEETKKYYLYLLKKYFPNDKKYRFSKKSLEYI